MVEEDVEERLSEGKTTRLEVCGLLLLLLLSAVVDRVDAEVVGDVDSMILPLPSSSNFTSSLADPLSSSSSSSSLSSFRLKAPVSSS